MAGLFAGVRAGTGRVAALLEMLTEKALEDASQSRRCCGVGVWHAPHRHHREKPPRQEQGTTQPRDAGHQRCSFHIELTAKAFVLSFVYVMDWSTSLG